MLLVPQVGLSAGHGLGLALSRDKVLSQLTQLYGLEVGRALTATAEQESRFNPDAHKVTAREDSRGVFQVNTKFWGDVVPMAAANAWEKFVAQARALNAPTSRGVSVLEDALSRAREIVRRTGAPFGEAFDLAWQYGSAVALAGSSSWDVDAIARRIEMMSDAAKAAAWRARNAAIRAAWLAFLGLAAPIVGAAAVDLLLVLVVLYFLFSSRERRARTTRYAAAGARALL
jgi:hypothetical protein